MSPPNSSAFSFKKEPNFLPIQTPAAEKTNVVAAMKPAADQILTSITAKPIPTASASILVATACTARSRSVKVFYTPAVCVHTQWKLYQLCFPFKPL